MMDLKDIIKWFVPCFHLLLMKKIRKIDVNLTLVCCLFLLLSSFAACDAEVSDSGVKSTFLRENFNLSSRIQNNSLNRSVENDEWSLEESFGTGRTFGRPFKKMIAGMLPIIFSMGAASTWAVIATIVGVKTLAVTLFILKILLIAGAAKVGAIFGAKAEHGHIHKPHQEWTPQKEIHLHIHNSHGQPEVHEEPGYSYSPWNREGTIQQPAESHKVVAFAGPPHEFGPQTISTPYGNYVRVDHVQSTAAKVRKRRRAMRSL